MFRPRAIGSILAIVSLAAAAAVVAAPAQADTVTTDTSVFVNGDPFVNYGSDEVWILQATNNGTSTTADPETIHFTYDEDVQPHVPGWQNGFSKLTPIGPNGHDCTITTKTFQITCAVPRLAAGATFSASIAAQADLGKTAGVTLGWTATLDGEPVDQNVANNTQYGSTALQPVPAPTLGPLHSDPGYMRAGVTYISPSHQYTLTMQSDGNLVEYGNGRALWSSHTSGNPGAYFVIEQSGIATVYSGDGRALWKSGESRAAIPYANIDIKNDGTFIDYDPDGTLWTNGAPGSNTLTAPSSVSSTQYLHAGPAHLVVQPDGNLVDYVGSSVKWRTNTVGNSGDVLRLQADGNLVLYSKAGKALWASHTSGTGAGNRLTLTSAGLLTLTHGSRTVWRVG